MGGEWNFTLQGDPATIDVKKYQQELIRIRQRYMHDPKLFGQAQWFHTSGSQKEPVDNIFVKFTYKCERHKDQYNWHQGEPGVNGSQKAWWVLYWDPSNVPKGVHVWADVYTRCSPDEFKYKSLTMQHHLAIKFPEHFQVYLGDGVCGYGDRELYWGVRPKHMVEAEANADSDSDGCLYEPQTAEDEWFLETM